MPRRNPEHMQHVREQILDAAMRCLIRLGYSRTSIRDICKESSLSIGAIYVHFKNKAEIIDVLLQRASATRDSDLEADSLEELEQRLVDMLKKVTAPENAHRMRLDLEILTELHKERELQHQLAELTRSFRQTLLRNLRKCTGNAAIPEEMLELTADRLQLMAYGGPIIAMGGDKSQEQRCIDCIASEFELLRGAMRSPPHSHIIPTCSSG